MRGYEILLNLSLISVFLTVTCLLILLIPIIFEYFGEVLDCLRNLYVLVPVVFLMQFEEAAAVRDHRAVVARVGLASH